MITAIVEMLDALDEKIRLHEARLPVLEELFAGMLTGLMNNELDVADLDAKSVVPGARDKGSAA